MSDKNVQRLPAEELFQRELDALIAAETDPVPTGWRMSPRSVLAYITGGTTVKGVDITPKYMGNRRLVEIAIATLITDRALLLIGEPGTAKSWLSEHLAAAVNGDSTKVVQGTAGTTEEQIKYSWNYAMLIAKGPCPEAMVKSPVYRAMESGSIARIEEISRCASEVQDALISILSEKRLSVPEAFLAVDAILGIYENVASGLIVHEKVIEKHILEELPFMASENIMMDAVKQGGDRQQLHERIRVLSLEAGRNVKELGLPNNLIDLIAADQQFHLSGETLTAHMEPARYIGRCPEQVTDFLTEFVQPVLAAHPDALSGGAVDLKV